MNTQKTLRFSTVLALIATPLMLATTSAYAQTISDSNVFTGATVAPYFTVGFPSSNEGSATGFNDGTGNAFIFQDNDPNHAQDVVFSGFTSAIDTLDIYNINDRVSDSVTIYYSNTGYTGSNLGNYTDQIGTFNLNYTNPTGLNYPQNSAFPISYASLTGLGLPSDTSSVLLEFARSNPNTGVRIVEVQAFAPAAAPEPSTYALLLLGAGSLVLFRRLRASQLS